MLNVGPGPVQATDQVNGYTILVRFMPNRADSIGTFSAQLLRLGRPINAARIRLTTLMLTMNMGYTGLLTQKGPGHYTHAWPPLGMSGPWRLQLEITPPKSTHFTVTLIDRVT